MSELENSFQTVDASCALIADYVSKKMESSTIFDFPNPKSEIPTVLASEYARGLVELWSRMRTAEKQAFFIAIELNVSSGNSQVAAAWATGFLECLGSELDEKRLAVGELLEYLGEKSLFYMNEWNEFNGLMPYSR